MREKLDDMDGGESTGSVNTLRLAVNAAEVVLEDHKNEPEFAALHSKQEEVGSFLCDDSTSNAGAADKIATFAGELETLTP